jgi:peptidoglycan/LPS O-acetylase OafA/YrhL
LSPAHRIRALDGLRAISISCVLIGHVLGVAPGAGEQNFTGHLAELGVGVFFVISGYLITTLLASELAKTNDISLRSFYLRRTFRIFPAYYTYVLVIAGLAGFGVVELLPGDVTAAMTYTVNYHRPREWDLGHLWSLAVEEQFYLIWPAVMLLARRRAALVAGLTVLAAPIIRAVMMVLWAAHRRGIGETFPTVADALAIGCLLALLQSRLYASKTYLAITSTPFAIAALVVLLVTANTLSQAREAVAGKSIEYACCAIIVDWAVQGRSALATRALDHAAMRWVGRLSYSLYLWQQPFLRHGSARVLVPCGLALAIVSYYAIELPFLRLRERIAKKTLG